MRVVAPKSADWRARVVAVRTRRQLVTQHTEAVNALRSPLCEFGHVAPEAIGFMPAKTPHAITCPDDQKFHATERHTQKKVRPGPGPSGRSSFQKTAWKEGRVDTRRLRASHAIRGQLPVSEGHRGTRGSPSWHSTVMYFAELDRCGPVRSSLRRPCLAEPAHRHPAPGGIRRFRVWHSPFSANGLCFFTFNRRIVRPNVICRDHAELHHDAECWRESQCIRPRRPAIEG